MGNEYAFFLVKEGEEFKVFLLFENKLHDISSNFDTLDENTNFVALQNSPEKTYHFITQQDSKNIKLFKMERPKESEEANNAIQDEENNDEEEKSEDGPKSENVPEITLVEDLKELKELDKNLHSAIIYDIKEYLIFFDSDSLFVYNIKTKKVQ